MLPGIAVAAGLLMTLWLPIYPQALTPSIVSFGMVCATGAFFGLGHARARRETLRLLPWALALLQGLLVGAAYGWTLRQSLEDAIPLGLFAAGFLAARASRKPERLLVCLVWICAADSAVSLLRMPAFDPGMRSTFFYFKITAGLPLIGLYVSGLLSTRKNRFMPRWLLAGVSFLMLIAVLASVSRGMILAAMIGLSTALYLRRRSLFLLSLILAGAIAVLLTSDLLELTKIYFRLDQASTVDGRIREVEVAYQAFSRFPLLGSGLGSELDVDGLRVTFVHNIIAYHVWKFGLIGCALLSVPLYTAIRSLDPMHPVLRSCAYGALVAVGAYLVTSAAYKTYYLLWIYGVVAGLTSNFVDLPLAKQRSNA